MLSGDVSKKFNIPIEHFDYVYIEKCNDVRELAKILRVLRAGDEGFYPDLEQFCERRIEMLDPENRILRKEAPVSTKYDLPPEEWKQISGELSQFLDEMAYQRDDDDNKSSRDEVGSANSTTRQRQIRATPRRDGNDEEDAECECNENLPPVRGTNVIVASVRPQPKPTPETETAADEGNKDDETKPPQLSSEPKKKEEQPTTKPTNNSQQQQNNKKKAKRVKPREYREWDKINVEEELKKMEEEEERERREKEQQKKEQEEKEKQKQPATVPPTGKTVQLASSTAGVKLGEINKAVLSENEVVLRAERDKEKGNEAFRAGDFDEALAYYNRSLSLQVTMPVLNNRAFTYLKLEKWDHAIKDCNTVLAEDPKNVKALFRRATAYKSRKQFAAAKKDLEKVLAIDASHQKAVDMLEEVKKKIESTKKEGNRLVIEETSENEEEEEKTHFSKNTLAHPNTNNNTNGSSNGHHQVAANNNNNQDTNNKPKAKPVTSESNKPKEQKALPSDGNKQKNNERNSQIVANVEKSQQPAAKKDIWGNDEVAGSGKTTPKTDEDQKKPSTEKLVTGQTTTATTTTKATVNGSASEEEVAPTKEPPPKSSNKTDKTEPLSVSYPAVPISILLDQLTSMKDSAGKLFTAGQYDEALTIYRKGINQARAHLAASPSGASVAQSNNLRYVYGLLLTNAAACHLKTGALSECVQFCTESLAFIPRFAKSHLRRATAYEALERFEEALADYKSLLEIEPSSKSAIEGKTRCESVINQKKHAEIKEDLGTRIQIEEDEDEDEDEEGEEDEGADVDQINAELEPELVKSSPRNKSVPLPTTVVVPTLPQTASAFDFAQAWTSLVKSANVTALTDDGNDDASGEDKQPVAEVDYTRYKPIWQFLKQIPSAQISKVFVSILDGTNFSAIINSIYYALLVVDEANVESHQFVSECLLQLTSVSRFTVALMFLSEDDQRNLSGICNSLAASKTIDQATKAKLSRHYAKFTTNKTQ